MMLHIPFPYCALTDVDHTDDLPDGTTEVMNTSRNKQSWNTDSPC